MQLLERWLYYHWLVVLDLWRLRRAFFLHVVIVAGICLPILILGALKRGHVAQLREDLLKSVTGRQVIAWSAQNGRILESSELADFGRELPHVEILVPEAYRPVLIRRPGVTDAGHEVTIYATLTGDPMLAELGAVSPGDDFNGIVLSKTTAESIGVATGDTVEVVLRRKHAGKLETGVVLFTVSGVFASSSAGGSVGYVPLSAVEDIERFVRGNAVNRWSLPAFAGMSAADRYAGYLVFCKKNDDLRQEDMKTLADRALDVTPVTAADITLLSRILRDGFAERLRIYRVMARQGAATTPRRLAIPPSDIAALTVAQDDIALAWNEPLDRKISGKPFRLVGLSFPERRWLRGEFQEPTLAFPTDAGKIPNELSVRFPLVAEAIGDAQPLLEVDGDITAPLAVVRDEAIADPAQADPAENASSTAADGATPADEPTDTSVPLAIVPAPLLAHLDALQRHEAMYDAETLSFPPLPVSPNYDKLRIYATSIDHVPEIVDHLRKQGYGVTSEFTRIKEIHDQDASLALLVNIVTWGVLLFGILTVSIVLIDSTDRKSKTIGIMRIMGVSSPAVSYMVMLRAAIIGICAAGMAAAFGWVFCWFLSWQPVSDPAAPVSTDLWASLLRLKPVALATLDLWQDRAFLLSTIACSVFGSLLPAIKASRLDPFDAVIQSRGG
jgi:ABC-type lipoprotein release transport system permease subunit